MQSVQSSYRPITSGRRLGSLRTGYFHFTEADYPAGYAVPPHGHETATITFVVRGALEERLAGRAESFGPRGLLLKPAGLVHSNRSGAEGARLLLVEVLPALAEATPAAARLLDRVRSAPHPRLAALLLRARRELGGGADPCAGLAAEGLLLELLAELGREPAPSASAPPERWLERVRERLQADFRRPLTVAALAEAERVPPLRLARAFRARYGEGIGRCLRRVRLEWVAGALAASERPIAELALEAGFADQSHLTREFRRAYGMAPAAWRRVM